MSDGDYFDADYFERGVASGKSLYECYRWQPRRSMAEALAFADLLDLQAGELVLDVGCAKGFLVRALRYLGFDAWGADISDYALRSAPGDVAPFLTKPWPPGSFAAATCKDTLEHCDEFGLRELLADLALRARQITAVVPLGDKGVYRIQEYHRDPSHRLVWSEAQWRDTFDRAGWVVEQEHYHVPGIKDKWHRIDPNGNMVFVLRFGSKA